MKFSPAFYKRRRGPGAAHRGRCALRWCWCVTVRPGVWGRRPKHEVFCPAFLQKSGQSPETESLAALRRARNTPCPHKVRKGVRGKPYQGVCPCSAEPKQDRGIWAGMEPRPYEACGGAAPSPKFSPAFYKRQRGPGAAHKKARSVLLRKSVTIYFPRVRQSRGSPLPLSFARRPVQPCRKTARKPGAGRSL